MIQNSFILLDGIGRTMEEHIWHQGIHDWHDFKSSGISGISSGRKQRMDLQLAEAGRALHSHESGFFTGKLPSSETWRLYDFFREETVFLDIETTGLGFGAEITVIGLYDGRDSKTMVKGINLDFRVLCAELMKHKLVATFNGASFDLPFISKRHPKALPDMPHIDLRCLCGKVGWSGGLKSIEQRLGIKRKESVERMHGGDAVTLWRIYRATGDDYYLKLLIEYNEEDVVNLQQVADRAYNAMSNNIREKHFLR